MTDANHDLVLERIIRAPRAAVWRCWTEPALLEQWFCPKPWRVTDARIDLRPGGEFYGLMRGPDGAQFPSLGVFLHVEPGARLITTDAFRPGWLPSERAFMVSDITFADAGGGKTHYRAVARHWSAEARAEHEAMGFHDGWGKAADQLEALAQTL